MAIPIGRIVKNHALKRGTLGKRISVYIFYAFRYRDVVKLFAAGKRGRRYFLNSVRYLYAFKSGTVVEHTGTDGSYVFRKFNIFKISASLEYIFADTRYMFGYLNVGKLGTAFKRVVADNIRARLKCKRSYAGDRKSYRNF